MKLGINNHFWNICLSTTIYMMLGIKREKETAQDSIISSNYYQLPAQDKLISSTIIWS